MIRKAAAFAVLLALGTVFLGGVWLARGVHRPAGSARGEVLFEVPRGSALRAVARRLKQEGLIERTGPFLAAYALFLAPRPIRAGEYAWTPPLAAKRALLDLVEGRVHLRSVTIPEGLTVRETAALLEAEGPWNARDVLAKARGASLVADLDPKAPNLEGYLFPETYFYSKETPAGEMVGAMVERFRTVLDDALRARAARRGLSIRQAVTLASLVEKETSRDDEKRLISAVFHNRLRIGMTLGCDPTIIYALKEEGRFDGNLRRRDLETPGPYNTYLRPGLPPGPICNPGRASLEAAVDPADVRYLYFVSRNDGSHVFSASFREHQTAVRRYQPKK
jgi:UPF0755 protein